MYSILAVKIIINVTVFVTAPRRNRPQEPRTPSREPPGHKTHSRKSPGPSQPPRHINEITPEYRVHETCTPALSAHALGHFFMAFAIGMPLKARPTYTA